MDDENATEELGSNLSGTWLVLLAAIPVAIISLLVFCHFQLGMDIPVLRVENTESATYWGQIGDFVGGVLNPILSFIALLAVVLSLRSQAAELKAARAEARTAQKTQTEQTEIFEKQSKLIERQSFETVFFGLLQLHTKNSETAKFYRNGSDLVGLEAFESYATKCNVDGMAITDGATDNHAADVLHRAESFYERSYAGLGRYFRTLFEIIVYVDNYGAPQRRSPFDFDKFLLGDSISQDMKLKRTYAGIVAATFSIYEAECIMLYCLSPEGGGLKLLCEKYGLLKHLPFRKNQDLAKALFDSSAFERPE